MKQSSSNLSLNRSSNSLKPSSPQPPRKPERSFIDPGNSGDIFKFDCKIERNPLKQSNGSLDRVVASQKSVVTSQDEPLITEKKKKKAKKEKKEKKKEKDRKVEKKDLSSSSDATAIDWEVIEKKENIKPNAEIGISLVETKTKPVVPEVEV